MIEKSFNIIPTKLSGKTRAVLLAISMVLSGALDAQTHTCKLPNQLSYHRVDDTAVDSTHSIESDDTSEVGVVLFDSTIPELIRKSPKRSFKSFEVVLYGNDNYVVPSFGDLGDYHMFRTHKVADSGPKKYLKRGGFDGGRSFHFQSKIDLESKNGHEFAIDATIEAFTYGGTIRSKISSGTPFDTYQDYLDAFRSGVGVVYYVDQHAFDVANSPDTTYHLSLDGYRRIDNLRIGIQKNIYDAVRGKFKHKLMVGGGGEVVSNLGMDRVQNTRHEFLGVKLNTSTYEDVFVISPFVCGSVASTYELIDTKNFTLNLQGVIDSRISVLNTSPSEVNMHLGLNTQLFQRITAAVHHTLGLRSNASKSDVISGSIVQGYQQSLRTRVDLELLRGRGVFYTLQTFDRGGYESFRRNIHTNTATSRGVIPGNTESLENMQMQIGIRKEF